MRTECQRVYWQNYLEKHAMLNCIGYGKIWNEDFFSILQQQQMHSRDNVLKRRAAVRYAKT